MTDRDLIRLAARTLEPELLAVWLQKHYQGTGRRAGSRFLGITPEQWRNRLDTANRKVDNAIQENAA
jgi:hypothetical protein